MKPAIFSFRVAREYVSHVLAQRQKQDHRYSLRVMARDLGYRSPSMLSAVLRGERSLKADLVAKLVKELHLSASEARYFELMTLMNNAKTSSEKAIYLDLLKAFHPEGDVCDLGVDRFRVIADWYHLAILEMVSLREFRADPKWIAKRLGRSVTPSMVEAAIERLIRLNLVERRRQKLVRVQESLETGDEGVDDAIQNHHQQMIEMAAGALKKSDNSDRDVRGTTFALREEDREAVIALTKEYHAKIRQLAATSKGDHIFRVNTQCFKIC